MVHARKCELANCLSDRVFVRFDAVADPVNACLDAKSMRCTCMIAKSERRRIFEALLSPPLLASCQAGVHSHVSFDQLM